MEICPKYLHLKEERSQTNNLSPHLKKLEKEEQNKPKGNRREETKKGQKSVKLKITEKNQWNQNVVLSKDNRSDAPVARFKKKK